MIITCSIKIHFRGYMVFIIIYFMPIYYYVLFNIVYTHTRCSDVLCVYIPFPLFFLFLFLFLYRCRRRTNGVHREPSMTGAATQWAKGKWPTDYARVYVATGNARCPSPPPEDRKPPPPCTHNHPLPAFFPFSAKHVSFPSFSALYTYHIYIYIKVIHIVVVDFSAERFYWSRRINSSSPVDLYSPHHDLSSDRLLLPLFHHCIHYYIHCI